MTFQKRENKDLYKIPLLDESLKSKFEETRKEFNIFKANFDSIKDYKKRLINIRKKDFLRIKDQVHSKMVNMPNLLNSLNEKINYLNAQFTDEKQKEFVDNLRKKTNEMAKELTDLMESIFIMEKDVSLNIMNLGLKDEDLDASMSILNVTVDRFSESKIFQQEVVDNQDYLISRKNDLEQIKKITGQLVKISENMGLEVARQEQILNNIENYIIDSKDNIIKADELIRDEVKTKGFWTASMKCLLFLVILVLIGLIIGIILILK